MQFPNDDLPDLESPPPLQPPQFSLRTLLLAMFFVAVLLTYWQVAGPLPTMLLVLLILAVVAHVAGNAIGTRLREHQSQASPPLDHVPAAHRPVVQTTNLSQRQRLGWPMWISIIFGAVVGAGFGTWLFLTTDAEKATWQDTSLGAFAFAVLGGMAGFALGSFVQVLFRAHSQARAGANDKVSEELEQTGSSSRNVAPNDSPSL